MSKNPNGIIYDMSSEDYHGHKGSYSSSQLKDLIEDPEVFYRKYVTKEIERTESSAFDVGTYFHTHVLEPHKAELETAVYEGIRRGKEWDAFKLKNVGKTIITENERSQAMGLIKTVRNSPIAMGRISNGKPEVSAFVNIKVLQGQIFCGELFLSPAGWDYYTGKSIAKAKGAVDLLIKVRADLLGTGYILDLKSTSGNAKSEYQMRKKISDYSYDLSAALYLDMFSAASEKSYTEFIWTFASKDYFNTKSYVASTENIQIGRAKYTKAILTLADYISKEWEFEDSMGILHPNVYELEWITQKGHDLL